jgi:hypothetical protein
MATATHANVSKTARYNALRRTHTVQRIAPTPAPGGAPGYMVHTYTSAKLGVCVVLARHLNASGMVVAYRVRTGNGSTYMVPAGCLAAHGTLFVPNCVVNTLR